MSASPVLGFAHRGARAHAPENTVPAFRLALEMGARGIESDVWLTADGYPALHHGGRLRRRGRSVPIGALQRTELPTSVPLLADLYDACGTDLDLSLDLKDGRSAEVVLATARSARHDLHRLWICGRGRGALAWRALDPDVRLVSDTRSEHVAGDWSAYLRVLRAEGASAVNLRRRRWTAALVTQVHDGGLLAFGWDAQSERRIRTLVELGCDAVYSDHVDRLVAVLGAQSRDAG